MSFSFGDPFKINGGLVHGKRPGDLPNGFPLGEQLGGKLDLFGIELPGTAANRLCIINQRQPARLDENSARLG
jgi:hypothetical protein